MAELFHDPIMVDEILHLLDLHPGDVVVDGTLGLAGHSLRFSEKIAPNGILYGFDWDQTMLNEARKRLEANNKVEIRLFHADFREIARILATDGIRAQGILLDLGFNSAQIDDPERGMSFKFAAPLDMRLDQSKGPTAEYVVNTWSVTQLEDCLFNLADEQWARAIAKSIVARRTPWRPAERSRSSASIAAKIGPPSKLFARGIGMDFPNSRASLCRPRRQKFLVTLAVAVPSCGLCDATHPKLRPTEGAGLRCRH